MRRFESEPAYVLHTRPYRETSFLCELFTAGHGRISVVAKGVRRPKSRGRGLLQPFTPLLISCVGRGELLTLIDFDANGLAPVLTGRRVVSAFYLNELLVRLMHREDPYPELFLSYQYAINDLEKTREAEEIQIVLRLFEKSLLKTLGYELQLLKEVETGQKISTEKDYCFDPARGPLLVDVRLTGSKPDVFQGKSLIALAEGSKQDMDKVVLNDLKRLMRLALGSHLGSKPLQSRRLL